MTPDLLMPKNVIVQGITGTHGTFHTRTMVAAGTNVAAGTSPTKAGTLVDTIPVYESVKAIQHDMPVDASVIFVPAPFAKAALLEAIAAGVPLVVCITEGIPVHDMLQVKKAASKAGVTLIGPNCPGILLPGVCKLGIIPASMGMKGSVGVVSRSGTLTYEAAAGLSGRGLGQKYIIGIGGDRIRGIGFIECLELFEKDPEVRSIVMIGEIGGTDEQCAADYIKTSVTKPVFTYIAGHHAPEGVQLGHAGAILGEQNESAASKSAALERAGAQVSNSITQLVESVQ